MPNFVKGFHPHVSGVGLALKAVYISHESFHLKLDL